MIKLLIGVAIAATTIAGARADASAFVTFTGPGYSVLVPSGWVLTRRGSSVTFAANGNSESIEIGPDTPREDLRKTLGPTGPTMTLHTLAGLDRAPAMLLTFRSPPKRDPLMGQAVEHDNAVYISTRNHRRAYLRLSAPAGADNVERWTTIAESFHWK